MLLILASILAVIYALLKPLSDGLFDTSMWVTKILAPTEFEDNDSSKQFMKIGQSALMQGWLSNIPFFTSTLFFSSIVISFFYSWWAGILMYIILGVFSAVMKLFFYGSVSSYLPYLYSKMLSVAADCKMKNDTMRYEASESFCRDLEKIIEIYKDASIKPPTKEELKEIPFGDIYFLIDSKS